MRISDWSSDVCSSDLTPAARAGRTWPPTTASSTDPYPRHLHGNGHGRSHEPVRATIAVPGTAPDRRRSIHRQGKIHDIRHLRHGHRTGGLARTVRDRKSTRLNSSH